MLNAASEQGMGPGRYAVIPRTTIFLRRGETYLLLKGARGKRLWADTYNGVGGHVDRGEDVLTSAARELEEETGLRANLWLCGTLIVDAGEVGVGLYILSGEPSGGELRSSIEGTPEWIPYDRIQALSTVEDLEILVSRIHGMKRGDPPFCGRSFYDNRGRLQVEFAA